MHDPLEGLTESGKIRTGVSRTRIPGRYTPLLDAAIKTIIEAVPEASIYLYGSVATGTAQVPDSDVDLLAVGVPAEAASSIADALSDEFADLCRGVEIGAAAAGDFAGTTDETHGNRVFLHHYCVLLAGAEVDRATLPFSGDHRAARGFNGDIGRHLESWRERVNELDAKILGRRAARKTLLAVAGLVSVHDSTWTTDRHRAAARWGELHPDLAGGLDELLDWSSQRTRPTDDRVTRHLDTTIGQIVDQFIADIGLWRT